MAADSAPRARSAARSTVRADPPRGSMFERPWWPAARRALTLVFFAGVAWLLVSHARSVEWAAVWQQVQAYEAAVLWRAAGMAALSYAVYASYDLIGRRHTGHGVPAVRVAAIGLVSYSFNLNLGSLVGGFAMRFRLYARAGLKAQTISELIALSMLTNWLGYLVLAGSVFLIRPVDLPAGWALGRIGLQALGAALLLAAAAYVLGCFFSQRREWRVAAHPVRLPGGRIALLQLLVSSVNWLLISALVCSLLPGRIDYASVLSVVLIAAVAGVIAHVPAGLGVLEAVFVALLSARAPQAQLLGALLVYRAVYYLAPLAVTAVLFMAMEARHRRPRRPKAAAPAEETAPPPAPPPAQGAAALPLAGTPIALDQSVAGEEDPGAGIDVCNVEPGH